MFVDKQCLLSDSQDLSQTAGSYYSTYAYNLGHTQDPGAGRPIGVVFCVDAAFVGSGATVQFDIIDEEDTTLDGSSVVIASTRAIAITSLTLGKVFMLPIPAGIITQQYIGVKYTIAVATTTAGTVSAFIAFDPPRV